MTLEEKGWTPWKNGGRVRRFEGSQVTLTTTGEAQINIDAHGNDRLLDAIELAVMETVAKFADERAVESAEGHNRIKTVANAENGDMEKGR